MITCQDLNQLQSLIKVLALSILLPTHRTSPDNKQDQIRVKNLVNEAVERLTTEFSPTYARDEELPLIVGGVDRQIAFFQEVSQYTPLIAGTLTGNFDRAAVHELSPQVWPIIQSVREAQRASALQELEKAMGAQNVVSTIGEAWRFAQEGRGKLLLVEKNYHVPAIVNDNGNLELVEQPGGTTVIDDAVDEIIEIVLAKGGRVAIVEDGSLSLHQHIALILRY